MLHRRSLLLAQWTRLGAIFAVMAASVAIGTSVASAQDNPTVVLVPSDTYGELLTDPSGWALYTWDGDSEGVSNCYDECTDIFEPYTIDTDLVAPDGLPGSLGLIERDDGTWQVTLDNWPLYYYNGDNNPGDTNGDGSMAFDAQWYVTAFAPPAPPVAQAPPPPPAPTPPPPPIPTAPPAPTLPPAPPVVQQPPATPVPTRAPAQVSIQNFAFQPSSINVQVGDTVMWTNNDGVPHTSTSDTNAWDSGRLNPGQTFSFTFNSPGTYPYHCAIHPQMRGQVVVGSGSTFGGPSGNPLDQGPFFNGQPGFGQPGIGGPFPPDLNPGFPPPPPPGGVPGNPQVTVTFQAPPTGNVVVSWIANPTAQSYRIYTTNALQPLNFSVAQTVPQTPGILATNATLTGLAPGQTYLLQVRAVDPAGGESPAPASVLPTGGAVQSPIPPPAGLVLGTTTGTSVTLIWTGSPGAVSYRILQATTPTGPFTPSSNGGTVNGTTTTVTGLTANTTYYFQVVGVDPLGAQSAPSNTVPVTTTGTAGPAAPTNLAVTGTTANTATLTWAPSPNAISNRVMVSTSPGAVGTLANVTNLTGSSATVVGLTPSTPYFFQVVAVDANGNPSPASNTAQAVTQP